MSLDTTKFGVQDYLGIAPACGLRRSNFAPQEFDQIANAVAQRNVPPKAPPGFVTVCTASLIARGIIYFKSMPGDCGTPTQIRPSAEEQVTLGIASAAANSLPGIGPFVDAIAGIFRHHDIAVANEQATICKVAGVINQVFYYYDNQVRTGILSPSTAYRGIQLYIEQVNAQLGSILKSCNAACVYMGVLAAHADFCETYYPQIAPAGFFSHAPGAPPANLGTAPGGVVRVGSGDIFLPFEQAFGFSGNEIFAGLAVLIIVLVILFAG